MLDQEFLVLLNTFRQLIRRNAHSALLKLIEKTHPADMATLFRSFSEMERETLFGLITPINYKAEFLTELDQTILVELLQNTDPKSIVDLLNRMAPDDQADVVAQLPEDVRAEVMKLMSATESEDLAELMLYPPDTAGGIMAPLPFKMRKDHTVQDAIKTIQQQHDLEMIFYIYVVDDEDHLCGVLSLRQLLKAAPTTHLRDIMVIRVISVAPETDQEEVARIIGRYNFLALPVVDRTGVLLGIVTVDDIIDVIREEATEDFLKMAGAGKEREILLKSPLQAVRIRFPWLFVTFVGGLIVSAIVIGFRAILQQFIILAAFMPVIAGMGGNVGSQSTTIVVRGLATGRINYKQILRVLSDQLKIGLILGLAYGLLASLLTNLLYRNEYHITMIAGVIGIAISGQILVAALLGTLIPMILHRLDIDPAFATGPLVSTTLDITGTLVYFSIALAILT